jgi:hypothetical protein
MYESFDASYEDIENILIECWKSRENGSHPVWGITNADEFRDTI